MRLQYFPFKVIWHFPNQKPSEMRATVAPIFVMMLSSLATADEQGGKVLRRTRDGNVVKTGCEELDSFINNLPYKAATVVFSIVELDNKTINEHNSTLFILHLYSNINH